MGDLGSYTGSKILPSGWFPCGFDIVGRPGPLHEAGQALGLLSSGSGPKDHGTHRSSPYSCLVIVTQLPYREERKKLRCMYE